MPLFRPWDDWVYRVREVMTPKSMDANAYQFSMLSHPGRVRGGNEDTCAAAPESGTFVVCDGMGGAAAGEVASHLATQAFLRSLAPGGPTPRTPTPDIRLRAAIAAANKAVFAHSRTSTQLNGMGTTLVALLLERSADSRPPSLTLAHVGDSRCYLFRAGALTQLTLDHSLVEEQVRSGELTADEAESHPLRNIITRAVGSQADVDPDILALDPQPGDLYLLASDGLTRDLPDSEIAATLARAQTRAETRAALRQRAPRLNLRSLSQTLIDQANDAGGGDNITVLLLALP